MPTGITPPEEGELFTFGIVVILFTRDIVYCASYQMNNFVQFLSCTESADVVPVLMSNTVRTPQLAEVKRVRNLFPETWIWLEYNARYNQQLF